MNTSKNLVLILLCVCILSSCTKNKYIATDNYDMLYVAEAYNAQFRNKSMTVYYSSDISRLIQNKAFHYIATSDNNISKPILKKAKNITITNTPSASLINNSEDNSKLFSFSLPLLIKLSDAPQLLETQNTRISLDSLKQMSANSISYSKDIYRLGFYPIDHSFSDMFETELAYTQWLNQAGINTKKILTYFADHYGPAPLISQLLDKNITYKYISSYTFFTLPKNIQAQFTIYLLTLPDNTVPAITPVYLGLVNNNTTKNDFSAKFIKWIFTKEAQESILKLRSNITNSTHTTFINNHLSSLWSINIAHIFSANTWLMDNQPLFSQIVVYRK